jgi:hypothetical protein
MGEPRGGEELERQDSRSGVVIMDRCEHVYGFWSWFLEGWICYIPRCVDMSCMYVVLYLIIDSPFVSTVVCVSMLLSCGVSMHYRCRGPS